MSQTYSAQHIGIPALEAQGYVNEVLQLLPTYLTGKQYAWFLLLNGPEKFGLRPQLCEQEDYGIKFNGNTCISIMFISDVIFLEIRYSSLEQAKAVEESLANLLGFKKPFRQRVERTYKLQLKMSDSPRIMCQVLAHLISKNVDVL